MPKPKALFACTQCGGQYPKWMGRCAECGAWDSIVEEIITTNTLGQPQAITAASQITTIADVPLSDDARLTTGYKEFDRVLGGGLVTGSVVLIGGDPGIGKSTLLLQALCKMSEQLPVLYITGEESLQQVSMRANRMQLPSEQCQLLAETQIERIISLSQQAKPKVIVIDSIQTMQTTLLQSAPGSVGQVRECAAKLVNYAKQNQVAVFLVGHVTKEGALAGPRVLEHVVDAVLYFEGQRDNRFRIVRAVKNRFGAVNELGVFAMTDTGLKEVSNPSALFLSRNQQTTPGSVVMATWEGTRPLLVEVQALVDESHGANPRRVTVGFDQNRFNMLLAVLHRHGDVATYNQDVFVNVVGGLRVTETGIDLAILLASVSSLRNQPLTSDVVVFGEVGLSGEIRPVQCGQERLQEAAKLGFKFAVIPEANKPKQPIPNLDITAVANLKQALTLFV